MQKATVVKARKKTVPPPVVVAEAPLAPVIPPKKQYLSNRVLFEEVKKCRKKGIMSDSLAKMLQMLCDNYARKGNFVNYSYNEDMRGYAMLMLVRTWRAFDPEKSNNPFAFFTQCIKHSFIQYLNQEKRQRNIRDLILVDQGLNPSFSFVESGSDRHFIDDEQDFQVVEHDAHQLKTSSRDPLIGDGDEDFPADSDAMTVDEESNSQDDAY